MFIAYLSQMVICFALKSCHGAINKSMINIFLLSLFRLTGKFRQNTQKSINYYLLVISNCEDNNQNEKVPLTFNNDRIIWILLDELGRSRRLRSRHLKIKTFLKISLSISQVWLWWALEGPRQKLILGSKCQVWLLYWIMSLCAEF